MKSEVAWCLFFLFDCEALCQPSSDWAGWVQAIGSIASIWAAWWIATRADRTKAKAESAIQKITSLSYVGKWRLVVGSCVEDCRKATLRTDQFGADVLHLGNNVDDYPLQLEARLEGILNTTNVDSEIVDATAEMYKQLQELVEAWMQSNMRGHYDVDSGVWLGWVGDFNAPQVIHARYHLLHPTLSRLHAVMGGYMSR